MPRNKKPSNPSEDIDLILKELDSNTSANPVLSLFKESDSRSSSYLSQQNSDEKHFIDTLIGHNSDTYTKLFQPTPSGIPLFFSMIADCNTKATREQKIKLLNDTLRTFLVFVRNRRNGEVWEPSTSNAFLRRFMSLLKSKYGATYSISEDFKFAGTLQSFFIYCSYFNDYYLITTAIYF
jgi:hypothetical protein